ncbi:MAG TPA: hypothetical protein VIM33_01615 [Gaiellaceae bacterium]
MEDISQEPEDRTAELIEGGSEIAGAAVGGALGLLAGPPGVVAGAVGGVLVTRALKRIGAEVSLRLLGPREEIRVGAAFAFAAAEIRERLERGDPERSDGWFEADGDGRPEAEELLEGVLLNAANAYEERKVPYLGWLYASLAFDANVGRDYANFLIRLADRLTYRELSIVALLSSETYSGPLMYLDVARNEGDARSSEPIIAELTELGQAGVVGVLQENRSVAAPQGTMGGGDMRSLPLAKLAPTPVGADLHRLMKLDRIPHEELSNVFAELGGDPGKLS